jgi:histidinol-phosphate/aromatic aminotransferase/cobyric acid decarboxylase-like protein
MKARGVLVKHIAGLHPLLANCLRLTVGTPTKMTLMMAALREPLMEPHDRTAEVRRDTNETRSACA